MPLAAGFVGILPALGLLEEDRDGSPPIHLTWIATVGWSCAVAFFGYTHIFFQLLLVIDHFDFFQRISITSVTQASGQCQSSLTLFNHK